MVNHLVMNNFEYSAKNKTGKRRRWVCTNRRRFKCNATLATCNKTNTAYIRSLLHSHMPNFSGHQSNCKAQMYTIKYETENK